MIAEKIYPLHSEIPTVRRAYLRDLIEYPPFSYVSAQKKLPEATGFRFKDISTFGATLWLIVDGKEIQYSKKKVRWRELLFYFPTAKSEIIKHGQVNIVEGV